MINELRILPVSYKLKKKEPTLSPTPARTTVTPNLLKTFVLNRESLINLATSAAVFFSGFGSTLKDTSRRSTLKCVMYGLSFNISAMAPMIRFPSSQLSMLKLFN